jgi:hypothetical protein
MSVELGLTLKSPLTSVEIIEAARVGLVYNPEKLTLNIRGDVTRPEFNYYVNQYKRVRLESLYNKYNDDFCSTKNVKTIVKIRAR